MSNNTRLESLIVFLICSGILIILVHTWNKEICDKEYVDVIEMSKEFPEIIDDSLDDGVITRTELISIHDRFKKLSHEKIILELEAAIK